jgi:hypothetical protein
MPVRSHYHASRQESADMTSYNSTMQKANFVENYEDVAFGRINKRIVHLDGTTATLVRFGAGASVTDDAVKPGLLDTDCCPLPHIGYILEGTLAVRQKDGSEETFTAGDVMMLPPDHEAWTVGDKDCLFVEFSRGSEDYYNVSH